MIAPAGDSDVDQGVDSHRPEPPEAGVMFRDITTLLKASAAQSSPSAPSRVTDAT